MRGRHLSTRLWRRAVVALAVTGTVLAVHSSTVSASGPTTTTTQSMSSACPQLLTSTASTTLIVASACGGGGGGGGNYCYASTCEGQDASQFPECSGDATSPSGKIYIYVNNKNVGYVELMWSATCKANWARTTRTDNNIQYGIFAGVYGSHGKQEQWSGAAESSFESLMTDGSGPAYACGEITESGSASARVCTNSY